jgi:hypothetical protein
MDELIKPNNRGKIAAVNMIEATHPPLEELVKSELKAITGPKKIMPIAGNCDTRFHAKHYSGKRPLDQIWWVVIHCTEGGTALAAARWFENPQSQGLRTCVLTTRFATAPSMTMKSRGCSWFQLQRISSSRLAMLGTRLVWSKTHRLTIQRAAFKTAHRCKLYKIPVQFCTAAMLKSKIQGITTHMECTKAFGGNHTDPGAHWPRAYFMSLVRRYYKQMGNVRLTDV